MMWYVQHLDKHLFVPIQTPANAQMHIIEMIDVENITATF